MYIDRTRDRSDLLRYLGCQREIPGHVLADDLNVDRRRKTEIQRLRHNVGGLKEEHDCRELFRQLFAEFLDIRSRWVMVWVQRYEDLRVGVANRFAGAIGQVDTAGGQADVVQNPTQFRCRNYTPDHIFGVARDARGFFNASAGLRP